MPHILWQVLMDIRHGEQFLGLVAISLGETILCGLSQPLWINRDIMCPGQQGRIQIAHSLAHGSVMIILFLFHQLDCLFQEAVHHLPLLATYPFFALARSARQAIRQACPGDSRHSCWSRPPGCHRHDMAVLAGQRRITTQSRFLARKDDGLQDGMCGEGLEGTFHVTERCSHTDKQVGIQKSPG